MQLENSQLSQATIASATTTTIIENVDGDLELNSDHFDDEDAILSDGYEKSFQELVNELEDSAWQEVRIQPKLIAQTCELLLYKNNFYTNYFFCLIFKINDSFKALLDATEWATWRSTPTRVNAESLAQVLKKLDD